MENALEGVLMSRLLKRVESYKRSWKPKLPQFILFFLALVYCTIFLNCGIQYPFISSVVFCFFIPEI